jgi:hypothetical protein
MIASIAAANRLPLFTTNPGDFQGLESVVTVVPVPIRHPAPERALEPGGKRSWSGLRTEPAHDVRRGFS